MQERKINRSNSLVNTAFKWIPILNQHYNHNIDKSSSHLKQFGSTVAVQKLRETKWFNKDEERIFCAVIECGFIVEIRGQLVNPLSSPSSSTDDEVDEKYLDCNTNDKQATILQKISHPTLTKNIENCHNEPQIFSNSKRSEASIDGDNQSWFGIALCKTLKDNKAKPDTIEIFSIKIKEDGVKVYRTHLDTIWKNNWQIRINNFADREKIAHNEKDIRNQVSFARKTKYSLWHNSKHFAYWCRYGSRQQDIRKRQMSECMKWGSVGMNAGMLLVMNNRRRSYSTSK